MDADIEHQLRAFVDDAFSKLPYIANRQEPQYVTSLMALLRGTVFKGHDRLLRFQTTAIDDRGFASAENKWGADFAVTALIANGGTQILKAALGQAKKGAIEVLNATEQAFLKDQIAKMRKATRDILVAQVPTHDGGLFSIREVQRSADAKYILKKAESLADYLVRMCDCEHGDQNLEFVYAVQDSSLATLKIIYEH